MITRIFLKDIASYKIPTSLETDKKVNLIYGLNGTGKSTISNYLYNPNDPNYAECLIEGLDGEKTLVYNQKFIHDNFYESETINGIFTLSRENKIAEQRITEIENEVKKQIEKGIAIKEKLEKEKKSLEEIEESIKEETWVIKTKYSGGDRVLEFCLEGLKQKQKILDKLLSTPKATSIPEKKIEDLKEEALTLFNDTSTKYDYLPLIQPEEFIKIEQDGILAKQIVGNSNSTISGLIEKLNNSDWIKQGIQYIDRERTTENQECPFCQEKTISKNLIDDITSYFDESYEQDIETIKKLIDSYQTLIENIPEKDIYLACPLIKNETDNLNAAYDSLTLLINSNLTQLSKKQVSPSNQIDLNESREYIDEINEVISRINSDIKDHNHKMDNLSEATIAIQQEFWKNMRWDYDSNISTYLTIKGKFETQIVEYETEIKGIKDLIRDYRKAQESEQKNTVNIEFAIQNINSSLLDLGINDFSIEKHETENFYRISRASENNEIFKSLSEGEKMVISFLYFIELCKGKESANDTNESKIVVIDDPISSLSHIYVFNIGRLIMNEFLKTDKYKQVFILTHSLYFFYELVDTKKERRDLTQKLLRLKKNELGSTIAPLKYEEIQNDYQAYWHIIKDSEQSPALIANCMRNIIEYFFNFVEKKDLNNVFQKPSLQNTKFDAFNRYINRESHSLGQNIFDIKEFNYDDFKDAFKLVFEETGYTEHFKRMMR